MSTSQIDEATAQAQQRIMSGASWEDFCDTLKSAGKTILAEGQPDNPLDRAEGFRYLSRLTRAALESFIEFADPLAPVFNRPVHETAKIGADNPDNYYQHATIAGTHEYKITGRRNTIAHLDFATQSDGVAGAGDSQQAGHLDANDIEIDSDGHFIIYISREKMSGNWLPMSPATTALIVRQTFADRHSEVPADLFIERIDGDGKPSPLTAEGLDEGLTKAKSLVVAGSTLFASWAQGFQRHTNELPKFDDKTSIGAGGDPNICYFHSYWNLGPEEALVIEATPPECDAWNFQLSNHWMESLDYRFHNIHVNKHTAQLETDGSVRIVVAHEDPGLPNWIETAGHSQGTMCFRWIRAANHPKPECTVVSLSELSGKA